MYQSHAACGANQRSDVGGDIKAGQREEGQQLAAVVRGGMGLTEVQVHRGGDVNNCVQKTQAP